MDNAVAFVQAYLRVNGYFTVSEYPIVEAMGPDQYRSATDLDILAFRFPHAGRLVPGRPGTSKAVERFEPAPELGCPPDGADMIVGEVKEGIAEFNQSGQRRPVLEAALSRFGCCPQHETSHIVDELLRTGIAVSRADHQIRLVAFGSTTGGLTNPRFKQIMLDHVIRFLQSYLRDHWELLRHGPVQGPGAGSSGDDREGSTRLGSLTTADLRARAACNSAFAGEGEGATRPGVRSRREDTFTASSHSLHCRPTILHV